MDVTTDELRCCVGVQKDQQQLINPKFAAGKIAWTTFCCRWCYKYNNNTLYTNTKRAPPHIFSLGFYNPETVNLSLFCQIGLQKSALKLTAHGPFDIPTRYSPAKFQVFQECCLLPKSCQQGYKAGLKDIQHSGCQEYSF